MRVTQIRFTDEGFNETPSVFKSESFIKNNMNTCQIQLHDAHY